MQEIKFIYFKNSNNLTYKLDYSVHSENSFSLNLYGEIPNPTYKNQAIIALSVLPLGMSFITLVSCYDPKTNKYVWSYWDRFTNSFDNAMSMMIYSVKRDLSKRHFIK